MEAFGKELDLYDVPFMLGGLGEFLDPRLEKHYTRINGALARIAQSHEWTGFVSAKGLTSNPDLLHFNSDSLYQFELRYFEEFHEFQRKDTSPAMAGHSDITYSPME